MAFWAGAGPALISAGGSLLSGLFGRSDARKQQRRNFENQLRLLREQARLEQVGYESPWRSQRWEGPLNNRRQVIELNPADQAALDQHRGYRARVMQNWNPKGGWYDDERGELPEDHVALQPGGRPAVPEGQVQVPINLPEVLANMRRQGLLR